MRPPIVSPADVEWIDTHTQALVYGHRFTNADIVALEGVYDRRLDGRLTTTAKQRIAAELTTQLRQHIQQAAEQVPEVKNNG